MNIEGKKVGALLVADVQKVFKTFRDEESRFCAFVFQKSVRAFRRTQTHLNWRKFIVECRLGYQSDCQNRCFFVGGDFKSEILVENIVGQRLVEVDNFVFKIVFFDKKAFCTEGVIQNFEGIIWKNIPFNVP